MSLIIYNTDRSMYKIVDEPPEEDRKDGLAVIKNPFDTQKPYTYSVVTFTPVESFSIFIGLKKYEAYAVMKEATEGLSWNIPVDILLKAGFSAEDIRSYLTQNRFRSRYLIILNKINSREYTHKKEPKKQKEYAFVNVKRANGQYVEVECVTQEAGLAITKDVDDARFYTITHLNSGARVTPTKISLPKLRKIMRHLLESGLDWTVTGEIIRDNDAYKIVLSEGLSLSL